MRLFEEGSDFSLSEPTRTTVRVDESTPPETPPPPSVLPHARIMPKGENTSSESTTGWKGLAWMFPEKKDVTTTHEAQKESEPSLPAPSHGWAALNWLPGSHAQQAHAAPSAPRPSPRSFSTLTKLLIFLILMLAFAGYYQYLQVKGAPGATTIAQAAPVETRTLEDVANTVGAYTSIAIGADGYPVISHQDETAETLKLYKCNDATCSSGTARTLDSSTFIGVHTSVTTGSDGSPVISYYASSGALKLYKCDNASCSSGTSRTLDSGSTAVGQYNSVAIGADGHPVISYTGTGDVLKLYKCDNTACSSGTARTLDDPANLVGYHTSIAIGSDGYPVISYQDLTARALKLYKCDNAACSSGTAVTLEDIANRVGEYSSIAIGSDGYPVVSHYSWNTDALKLYKCDNVACSSGTARTLEDIANAVGEHTSIAIGSDGYPVISYEDSTAGALKLYECHNVACSSGTARTLEDVTNSVGAYTDIAIGRDGQPVISYQDATAGALKFAYFPSRSVTINTTPTTTGSTLGNGLVGHWTFDGPDISLSSTTAEIRDRSSVRAHGDWLYYGLGTSTLAGGVLGQGINFTASYRPSSPRIRVATSTSYNNLSAMTLSAWVKYTDTGGTILDKTVGRNSGWYWTVSNPGGNYGTAVFFLDTSGANLYKSINLGPRAVDGGWHHVLLTWAGSMNHSDVKMYIDGQEATYNDGLSTNGGTRASDSTSPLEIGYFDFSGGSSFNGTLDDVRIYNRVLSADEIAELYAQGTGSEVGICGEGGVRDADGNTYGIVQIGTQCWLDRNMNVGTRINVSSNQTNNATIEKHCYNDTASYCTDPHPKHPDGGLYQWDEAMQYSTTEGAQGICPAGWHIPTDAEWHTLEEYLKDAGASCDAGRTGIGCASAATKLKNGGLSNFNANFAGAGINGIGSMSRDEVGAYWTSRSLGGYPFSYSVSPPNAGLYRNFETGYTAFSYSVRCIKD